ncbi:MAG TPA: hypothetical protein VFY25_06395, partial [Anaerolineales bacterium]|nr:hypothetical protein [Anaerolineales bacterium]
MTTRKLINLIVSVLVLASLVFAGSIPVSAENAGSARNTVQNKDKDKKLKQKDFKEAAARALFEGALNPLMVDPTAAMLPGDVPHYFSHPNYANSPLPMVTTSNPTILVGNGLLDRTYASDFPVVVGELAPVFVVVSAALPDGLVQSFQTWNQATPGASPFPSAGNVFHAYVLRPTANPNEYKVVFDSGLLTVPALADPAVGEVATFGVANLAVQAGDLLAFYGQGIPVDTGAGDDVLHYPAVQPLQDSNIVLGSADYPTYPQPRTYSFGAQVVDLSTQNIDITGGIRKFVDTLPGLNAANNLGQSIPVAVPDTTTYPGSDYYVIELGQYTEKMHSDLPPTTLRGYRQAGGEFHYLGPAIVATTDRPVRILFRNLLPTGEGGNLFIPVDTTVMGSGMTPAGHEAMDPTMVDPQNPMCSDPMKAMMVADGHCFAENRATLHLHGGVTPWISDGTPHQWITPAGEHTAYPEGVSVVDVPDMPAPAAGEMTFFYTNQQSARLMFYHDHAWGITRLN